VRFVHKFMFENSFLRYKTQTDKKIIIVIKNMWNNLDYFVNTRLYF